MRADVDVVVIGAGFSGLYAIHKFRDEMNMTVAAFDLADGPGGTWFWNRYPGARCDFESVYYSFSFSDELENEWRWSERFAGQPEILAYFEWVTDRLDLRRSISFGVGVERLDWDDTDALWTVRTSDGARTTARFVVSGAGGLSKPKAPEFPGSESFQGELYATSTWPAAEVDLTGKRIAVVGTGSSGVQTIQEVAKVAGSLTVFQRSANYVAPLGNRPISAEQQEWNALHHAQIRAEASPVTGARFELPRTSALAVSAEERKARYDQMWERGALALAISSFIDISTSIEANDTLAEYIRDRIKAQVHDPRTAKLLCPVDHPYATKRPPLGTNYYEVYNQDNVVLVDARTTPVERITERGIRTSDQDYEFDVIILSIGFDAFTGAQLAVPTVGRGGVTLKEHWADGPASFLGLASVNFPNLFNICGPPSAASQYNTPTLIEKQVDFVAGAIVRASELGARAVEPLAGAEEAWDTMANDILQMTLLPLAPNTWFLGDNIAGKPRKAYAFLGGPHFYLALCEQVQALGYSGFAFDGTPATDTLPPLVRLNGAAALAVSGAMLSGAPPMEDISIEEMRAQVQMQTAFQIPGRTVSSQDVAGKGLRVYRPDLGGPLPVVVFYHGGGFVAGSVEAVDPLCGHLAEELGSIVVAVDYRLAPEHPYPAAVNDSIDAVRWTVESIADFGGDPRRISLMGESAGAHMAAVTALQARDEGIDLVAQVLVYPPIDPEAATASVLEFAHGPILTAAAGERFWELYLAGADITWKNSPNRASLAGVAPALVVTVELDVLRDEGEDYARLLADAGVEVERHRVDGVFHGALSMQAMIPKAREITDVVRDVLRDRTSVAAVEHNLAGAEV